MKTVIAVSIIAALAMTSGAQAGGYFTKKSSNVLSNITGIVAGVTTRDVNVLNGNTIAIGNNSSILSGIGNVEVNDVLNGVLVNNKLLNGALNGNGLLGLNLINKKGW